MTTALTLRPTLYEETVPGGGHTSFVLKRGQLLRLTDIEGGANVSLLRNWLRNATVLRVFNVGMAVLLVISLYPILADLKGVL